MCFVFFCQKSISRVRTTKKEAKAPTVCKLRVQKELKGLNSVSVSAQFVGIGKKKGRKKTLQKVRQGFRRGYERNLKKQVKKKNQKLVVQFVPYDAK